MSFGLRTSILLTLCLAFSPILSMGEDAHFKASTPNQGIDESVLTRLAGNTHPLARPEFDRGAIAPEKPMQRLFLVLKRTPEREAALQQLLARQQEVGSQDFHRWLTPEQFGESYGPTRQQIANVSDWLRSHGFEVSRVAKGRMLIEFSGTAAQVQEAFHVSIHNFVVNGEEHWSNTSDPRIPAALSGVVAGVDSLNSFPRKAMHHLGGVVTRSAESGKLESVHSQTILPKPGYCGVQYGECYGVSPYDFASIYNLFPLWNASPAIDGTGESIAIVGETNIHIDDVRSFRSIFGLPAKDPIVIVNGIDPGINGDEVEADLDLEWSGAVAPNATIYLVTSTWGAGAQGTDLSAEYIVDHNLAPVMSESYGGCEFFLGTAENLFLSQLWQQAAAQGITAFVSSGDSGSAMCGSQDPLIPVANYGMAVNGVASTPYNVAVGGTDFDDATDASDYWNSKDDSHLASVKGYIPERTWNQTCANTIFGTLLGYSTDAEVNCNNPYLYSPPASGDYFVDIVAGSGGPSTCISPDSTELASCKGGYPKPQWQSALTPKDGVRDVPDVSLFAANQFSSGSTYLVCDADSVGDGLPSCTDTNGTKGEFLLVGGTSVASPTFAGIMALINQKTGERQGNANYMLYRLAAVAGASCDSSGAAAPGCIFHDVTTGTIAVPCAKGSPDCTLKQSADLFGVLPGYNASAGYDLATGLGSVNAANLVSAWAAASTVKPTVTTLTSFSPTKLVHGQKASFAIGVTANSGTPTGSAFLTAALASSPGGEQVEGSASLNNGTAVGNTDTLPGGSYMLAAHYGGDTGYAASVSAPFGPVTVSAEADVLTLDVNDGVTVVSQAAYGDLLALTARIIGKSGVGGATGSVAIADNGVPLAGSPFAINNQGDVNLLLEGAVLPAMGQHSYTATYAGDVSFQPSSTTAPAPLKIAKSMVYAFPPGGELDSLPFTFCGYVLYPPVGVVPTGTMTFIINGATVGTSSSFNITNDFPCAGMQGKAWASIITSKLKYGVNTVSVVYSGDANYEPSTSPTSNIILRVPTTTTVTSSSATFADGGQAITFTAKVTANLSGFPMPAGEVSFGGFGPDVFATLDSNGVAKATIAFSGNFLADIYVDYQGDTYFSPSGQVVREDPANGDADFALTANPGTVSIAKAATSGTTTITIAALRGFTGTFPMGMATCTGLPDGYSCAFSPNTVTLDATHTTGSAILTISGPAAQGSSQKEKPSRGGLGALAGLAIASVVLAAGGRRRIRGLLPALMVLAVLMLLASLSCGGGGGAAVSTPQPPPNPPPNPPQTYTVTVTVNYPVPAPYVNELEYEYIPVKLSVEQ